MNLEIEELKVVKKLIVSEKERVEFNLKMQLQFSRKRPKDIDASNAYHQLLKKLEIIFNQKNI